jgi:hypothetical protein
MAVSTVTTLTELVNAEWISDAVLDYAMDVVCIAPYTNMADLRGKASSTASFVKWVADTATDRGETDDLAAETLETTQVACASAECGVRRDITDHALEDGILGANLFDFIVKDAGVLLGVSLDDDLAALLGGFSTVVGVSGSIMTLANMAGAASSLRKNKMRGDAVYIIDDKQAEDYQSAIIASTSTTINSFSTPGGTGNSDYLGTFMGMDVFSTSLTDTANLGADVTGGLFIHNPLSSAALGMCLSRDVRVEFDRNITARTSLVVATARWGVAEISDLSGVSIITDA